MLLYHSARYLHADSETINYSGTTNGIFRKYVRTESYVSGEVVFTHGFHFNLLTPQFVIAAKKKQMYKKLLMTCTANGFKNGHVNCFWVKKTREQIMFKKIKKINHIYLKNIRKWL